MRVRNNQNFNIKLMQQHGVGGLGSITIVAGSVLELEDELWKPFASAAKNDLECGNLTIVKAVALTAEEEAKRNADALAAAEKLIKDAKAPKSK